MSISNSESRTADASPAKEHSTALRAGSIGVMGILFFVLSAQAPLTGIAGASPLAAALGNGAGAPGAYLIVGVVIVIFAVGFVAMSRRIQGSGAFYAYVTAAFGRKAGAGAAWLALLAYSTVQAAMYGLYGAAFSGLLASVGASVPWWVPALATMAGVQVLGSLNIELGAKVLALLVGLEVAILLMFGFTVLFSGGGPEGISIAASFSPEAIAAGAPGVAIMFAVASMFGFESTAIYSAEAKDAHRTVARATYLSVAVIAVFFSFISWMLVSYYGPSQVMDAAGAALESGDSTSFVLAPMVELFGPWAGTATGILLVTSLLAGIIAFHNGINRYLHSLALQGSMPAVLARTNRHRAPAAAARIQTATAVSAGGSLRSARAGSCPDPVLLVQRTGCCCTPGAVHPVLGGRGGILPARTGGRPVLADLPGACPGHAAAGVGAGPGGQQFHRTDRRQRKNGRGPAGGCPGDVRRRCHGGVTD
jgi:amino acid transporter